MSEEVTVVDAGNKRKLPLEAGVRVGQYTLTGRQIGSGGYAHVYEATHPTMELRVAVKIQDAFGDATIRARGLREAMVLARIQHRNVVQIFDTGELADGRQYLAMELLTGETLRDVVEKASPAPARSLAILRGVASALDAVHARGLVHRDLKPSNIFVCRDDDGEVYPKLIDFGIAKDLSLRGDGELTTTGSFIGTPAYMSPEQCLGKRTVDARSDIYALGIVAYQLLAGHPPFEGVLLDVAHAHAHAPVPSIRDHPELDAVFAQILAKDPAARPAAASEAIDLLEAALCDMSFVPMRRAFAAPHRSTATLRLLLLALIALVLSVASFVALTSRRHAISTASKTSSAAAPLQSPSDAGTQTTHDAEGRSVAAFPGDAAPDAAASVTDAGIEPPKKRRAKPVRHQPPPRSIDDVESLPAH